MSLKRLFHSPTVMTWFSFTSRSLGIIAILPLLLTKLSTAEIALWYLFATIITLQQLADLGFSQTFARTISYAFGGAEVRELGDQRDVTQNFVREPNWVTLGKIWGTMRVIYLRLSILAFFLLLIFGTLAIIHTLSSTSNLFSSWVSWVIILFASLLILKGNKYSAYLQGLNKIAILRRWEAIFNMGSFIVSFFVLYINGGLLWLVFTNQLFRILNIQLNKFLSVSVENKILNKFYNEPFSREVFTIIWPSTWRSGLGIISAQGPIQFSGLIFAQMGSSASIASFLFSLRILRMISNFSQAPFYSKIPKLTIQRIQGKVKEQLLNAQKGMRLSYIVFVMGWSLIAFLIKPTLVFINSNIKFVDSELWALLGLGMFLERYGAMHLQLYSTTNHIVWHIANGITGVLFITIVFLFIGIFKVYIFPIAMILSYLLFYTWYSAKKSYAIFDIDFWRFEKNTSIVPFAVFIIVSLVMILY